MGCDTSVHGWMGSPHHLTNERQAVMTDESPEQMLRRENNPHDDGRAQAAADLMASADIKELWLQRLESGNVPQAGEALADEACCLGVLCDITIERPREFRPIMRQPLTVRFRRRLAQMVMDWADRVATFASDRIWK